MTEDDDPRRSPRRSTSVDVARHLGISQSTVSLALSGSARISAATRRRVEDACRELGYRPSAAGRRLRTGRSFTIGLFVPKLGYEVFDRILVGVRSGLAGATPAEQPWSVLVGSTDNDLSRQESLAAVMGAHDFDGLILAAVHEPDLGTAAAFAGPVVGIETAPHGAPVRTYDLDQAARTVLDLLIGLGHRRIAHLTALPAKTSFATQRSALQRALGRSGRGVAPLTLLDADDVTVDAGIAALAPWWELPPRIRSTALICDDSRLAAAAYAGAADRGLRIPADLSVVTTHLDDVGRAIRPQLTGLQRPAEAVGALAAAALVELLAGRPIEPEILLPCALVPGASVGPPAF